MKPSVRRPSFGMFALPLGFFGAPAWSGVEGFVLFKNWFGRCADPE